jgi:hypothetical protein
LGSAPFRPAVGGVPGGHAVGSPIWLETPPVRLIARINASELNGFGRKAPGVANSPPVATASSA